MKNQISKVLFLIGLFSLSLISCGESESDEVKLERMKNEEKQREEDRADKKEKEALEAAEKMLEEFNN